MQLSMFPSDWGIYEIIGRVREANRLHAEAIVFLMTNQQWGASRFLHQDYQREAIDAVVVVAERILSGGDLTDQEWHDIDAITAKACRKTIAQNYRCEVDDSRVIHMENQAIKSVYFAARLRMNDAMCVARILLEAAGYAGLDVSASEQYLKEASPPTPGN